MQSTRNSERVLPAVRRGRERRTSHVITDTHTTLAADGEEIGLYSPDGGVVDELEYGLQQTDHAAARQLDGGSEWMITDAPTPGTSNGASP